MAEKNLPYEERKFVFTSDTIRPDNYRTIFENGWSISRRETQKRVGLPPLYVLTIIRPKRGPT
jgi:hypothetical protein